MMSDASGRYVPGADPYRIFMLCEESLSLFEDAGRESRFGGAGLQMWLLGRELAKHPDFEVSFIFDRGIGAARAEGVRLIERRGPVRRGLPLASRYLNLHRRREPYRGPGRKVIISTQAIRAAALMDEARLAGAKSVYRVASETDVSQPRGVSPAHAEELLSAICAADRVVTQTEHQRETLLNTRGKDSVVIRKGLPVPKVQPGFENKSGVLWVGSAQVLKQPWYFLDLARDFPNEAFTMIAPTEVPQVHEYIRRQAAEIPNLKLIDHQVPYLVAQQHFDASSLYVHTTEFSSHPENTVLQACAGACAILSLRLDPDEMANQGVLLSAEGDYLRLRQLLRGLLDNPSECADLGSRAFTYMREKYNIDRMTNEYAHLIRSMF